MALFSTRKVQAEGDQFLDGIGETALIARYLFDGNLEDWSRNSLHASFEGGEAKFVEDDVFGQVLELPGSVSGTHVRLPGQSLNGQQSISIAGWVKLNDDPKGESLFDVGTGDSRRLKSTLTLHEEGNAFSAMLRDGEEAVSLEAGAFFGRKDKWMHLAVVLDSTKRTLALYIDGKRFETGDEVQIALEDLLDSAQAKRNHILVGGSIDDSPSLNGRLYDVRFYRIALSERQVAVIHHNAISEDKWGDENTSEETEGSYRADQPRQLVDGLVQVESVAVKTVVGSLPELPYYLYGVYADGIERAPVRVLWPAPENTEQVDKPGTYTLTGRVPGTDIRPVATVVVTDSKGAATPNKHLLKPMPLGQVLLNPFPDGMPTPFIEHRDKFIEGLAKSDPNSFLYNFRDAFGQPQPEGTEPLYVWDSQTCRLRGHGSGHYLTAIAQAYASSTYDPELHALFKEKMDYMVDVLYELSQMSGKPSTPGGPHVADPNSVPAGPGKKGYDSDLSKDGIRTDSWNWGLGFISAYPPDQFIMLEQGASYGTDNDQVWAPYYTLHKILAGLMDIYELSGNTKALKVAEGMGLWVYERLREVPEATRIKMWNSYIAGEYGGMNEAMARLFRITGDERFLECAKLFDNIEFFFGDSTQSGGLVRNVDTIRGKHANQHIPQITGALETYRDTHEPEYYRVVKNFWEMCTHSYMYSIGGVAGARKPNNAECFPAEPDTLFRHGLADGGQNETCATYNLLKLGRSLFLYEVDEGYMDYYEQALYNHILASVAEDNAGNTYHVPLNPGAVKHFGNAEMNGFTCCNGTAIESATKLQNTIYFANDDDSELYVNLYVPSTLDWSARGIKLTQDTHFPYEESSRFHISGAGEFTLKLRIPDWATHGVALKINGNEQKFVSEPGSYLTLNRNWKDGDTVELELVMGFHLMPLMDQPNIASIFYGPVLLAAQEDGPLTDWRRLKLDPEYPDHSFKREAGTLNFEAGGVTFKPFFETYGHHSVYLNIVTEDRSGDYPPITVMDPPEDGFFAKQLDFHGIPIKASPAVVDLAFYEAYDRLSMLMENLPGVRSRLAEMGAALHVIGRDEDTTDLPEYRDMKGVRVPEYGGLTYDERARGFGGLKTSCGEENLLRLPEDRYRGSDICVHEFAHNILDNGSAPEMAERFEAQRKRSLAKGLWVDSYASLNESEFFAELAMWYFGSEGYLKMQGEPPAPGPEGLKAYDPEAFQLVDDFWSGRLSQ